MKDILVVDPRSKSLPLHPHLPPTSWMCETLSQMAELSRQTPESCVVWNFSRNKLSFQHVKFIALWLQVPDTNLKLYALDLSFNRISVPDWASFVPLVDALSMNVEYMHFGGNRLPPVSEDPVLQTCAFEKVSLGLAEQILEPNACMDSWALKANRFQREAYGQPEQGTRSDADQQLQELKAGMVRRFDILHDLHQSCLQIFSRTQSAGGASIVFGCCRSSAGAAMSRQQLQSELLRANVGRGVSPSP